MDNTHEVNYAHRARAKNMSDCHNCKHEKATKMPTKLEIYKISIPAVQIVLR